MIKRITAIIKTENMDAATSFYGDIFGMDVVMDIGWVMTMEAQNNGPIQITFASHSGSGAPDNDVSIEVDDFDAVLNRIKTTGHEIIYGPVNEPWGVRRFFVRDPLGKVLNVMTHI